jgi:hypothetical protein
MASKPFVTLTAPKFENLHLRRFLVGHYFGRDLYVGEDGRADADVAAVAGHQDLGEIDARAYFSLKPVDGDRVALVNAILPVVVFNNRERHYIPSISLVINNISRAKCQANFNEPVVARAGGRFFGSPQERRGRDAGAAVARRR